MSVINKKNQVMKRIIKHIILVILTFSFFQSYGQDTLTYVKRISKSKIEVYSSVKDGTVVLESPDKAFSKVSVSPNGKYISFIERPIDLAKSQKNGFKVYSASGKLVHSIDEDIRRYSWSGNDKKIAMISGKYYEGGIGFLPEKLLVYNVEDKSIQDIMEQLKEYSAYEIAWNPDNTILYIKTLRNSAIFKYDFKSGRMEQTEMNDIYISPDSKYYYQKYDPIARKEFAVYRMTDNKKIKIDTTISKLNNLNKNEYGELIGWDLNQPHVLLFEKKEEKVEYKDIVIQEKTKVQGSIVLRDYTSREVIGINYKYYDVESDAELRVVKTNGEEHDIITSPKKKLQKDVTTGQFKSIK